MQSHTCMWQFEISLERRPAIHEAPSSTARLQFKAAPAVDDASANNAMPSPEATPCNPVAPPPVNAMLAEEVQSLKDASSDSSLALLAATSALYAAHCSKFKSLPVQPSLPGFSQRPRCVFKRPRISKGSAFIPPLPLGYSAKAEWASAVPSVVPSIVPCCVGAACFGHELCESPSDGSAGEILESESSLMSPPPSPVLSSDKPASRGALFTDNLLSSAGSGYATGYPTAPNIPRPEIPRQEISRLEVARPVGGAAETARPEGVKLQPIKPRHKPRQIKPQHIAPQAVTLGDVDAPLAKRAAAVRYPSVPALQDPTATPSRSPTAPTLSAPVALSSERQCISCLIKDTPCWRPSWDWRQGQLCNSCGLRYRKTRVRCPSAKCRNIPSKMDLAALRAHSITGELNCPSCQTRLIRD